MTIGALGAYGFQPYVYNTNAVKRYVEGEAGCFRRRTKFGVLASKVKDVKKGTNDAYQATSVFVSQKKGVIE